MEDVDDDEEEEDDDDVVGNTACIRRSDLGQIS